MSEPDDVKKELDDLLKEMERITYDASSIATTLQTKAMRILFGRLVDSLNRNAESSDFLAKVLIVFTYALVLLAVIEFVLRYFFSSH